MRSMRTVASVRLPHTMCGVRPSSLVERTTRLPPRPDRGGPQLADQHSADVGRRKFGEAGDDDAARGVRLNCTRSVVRTQVGNRGQHRARRHGDFDHQRRLVVLSSGAAVGEFDSDAPRVLSAQFVRQTLRADRAALPELVLHVLAPSTRLPSRCLRRERRASPRGRCRREVRSWFHAAPSSRSIAVGVASRFTSRSRIASDGRQIRAGGDERRGFFRQRFDLERQLRDDAERAERTGEQLAEVVAGDVLHDAAAALERDAAAVDGVDADHVVAHRAVAEPARAGPVRGHDAAERGLGRAGHVDRQLLPLGGERGGKVGHADAGFDDDRHVARRVVDDAVELREVELGGHSAGIGPP